jgi:hypothetical protein
MVQNDHFSEEGIDEMVTAEVKVEAISMTILVKAEN